MIRYLAMIDTFNLVVMAVDNAIVVYKNEIMYSMDEWGCRLGLFVVTFLQYYESWVVVVLTLERYVSIVYPIKAKLFLTRSRLNALLGFLFVFIFIDTLPHIINFGIVETAYVFECQPTDKFGRWFINQYAPIARVILHIMLPFGILLFCNIAIIIRLVAYNRKKDELDVKNSRKIKLNKIGPLLLAISFTFLITQSPLTIYLRTDRGNTHWLPDPVSQAYLDLEFTALFALAYINYAINVGIYVLTNKEMRQNCKELFSCIMCTGGGGIGGGSSGAASAST